MFRSGFSPNAALVTADVRPWWPDSVRPVPSRGVLWSPRPNPTLLWPSPGWSRWFRRRSNRFPRHHPFRTRCCWRWQLLPSSGLFAGYRCQRSVPKRSGSRGFRARSPSTSRSRNCCSDPFHAHSSCTDRTSSRRTLGYSTTLLTQPVQHDLAGYCGAAKRVVHSSLVQPQKRTDHHNYHTLPIYAGFSSPSSSSSQQQQRLEVSRNGMRYLQRVNLPNLYVSRSTTTTKTATPAGFGKQNNKNKNLLSIVGRARRASGLELQQVWVSSPATWTLRRPTAMRAWANPVDQVGRAGVLCWRSIRWKCWTFLWQWERISTVGWIRLRL